MIKMNQNLVYENDKFRKACKDRDDLIKKLRVKQLPAYGGFDGFTILQAGIPQGSTNGTLKGVKPIESEITAVNSSQIDKDALLDNPNDHNRAGANMKGTLPPDGPQ